MNQCDHPLAALIWLPKNSGGASTSASAVGRSTESALEWCSSSKSVKFSCQFAKKKKLSLNRCAQITGHGGHAKIITANPASFPSSLRKKNKVPGWMTIKWIQGICPPFATSKKWPKCPTGGCFPLLGSWGSWGKTEQSTSKVCFSCISRWSNNLHTNWVLSTEIVGCDTWRIRYKKSR